jgi:hypothetical protein
MVEIPSAGYLFLPEFPDPIYKSENQKGRPTLHASMVCHVEIHKETFLPWEINTRLLQLLPGRL